MSEEDCTIGKDFNNKTCRYVKGCKNGYIRNKDFKCVKDTEPINSKKSPKRVQKEKMGLLKELFSNRNGLVNSPPSSPRKKSKHLTKTQKSNPKSKIPDTKSTILKQFQDFLEKNYSVIEQMNWGQTKEFAKNQGINLDNRKQKNLFRDTVVDFFSKNDSNQSNKTPKANKGKSAKKVQFTSPHKSKKANSVEPSLFTQIGSFITGEPSKKAVKSKKAKSVEPSLFTQFGSFIAGESSKKEKVSKPKSEGKSKAKPKSEAKAKPKSEAKAKPKSEAKSNA